MRNLTSLFILITLTACGGGAAERTDTSAPAAFAPTVVVFEGDSLTQINDATTWPNAVQAGSNWSATWKNFATSGATTITVLARYAQVRKPARMDGVFIIHAGANDVRDGYDAQVIYHRLKMEWSQARKDGFRVIAATTHAFRAESLNALIRSDPGLYDGLVEYDKLFPNSADRTMLYDGLHYTPAANVRIIAAVNAALANLK